MFRAMWPTSRAASMVIITMLAASLIAGCTSGGEPDRSEAVEGDPPSSLATSSGGAAESSGVQTIDPTDVPTVETVPPTFPTNAPGRQDSVLDSLPGEAKAGCIEVTDERDARSGSMAAGNFVDAVAQFAEAPEDAIPFYFIPVDITDDPELVVELEQLDGSGSQTVRSSQVGTANEWRYYPLMLEIPAPGTWRIKASVGDENEGCWDVTFGR